MKRKASIEKPKVSASQGFNNLFKKKKKVAKIEATIDLCDSDDDDQKENVTKREVETEVKSEPKVEAKIEAETPKSESKPKDVPEVKNEVDDSQESFEHQTAMVKVVRLMVTETIENEAKRKLLDSDAMKTIEKFGDLAEGALDGLLRWYRRRQGWREKLKSMSDQNHQSLIDAGLIEPFEGGESFEQNLKSLKKTELYTVATRMNIEKKHRKTMDSLKQKMMHDFKTYTKSSFGAKTPSERLAAQVEKQLIGSRFRIMRQVQISLDKLILAYSPTLISFNSAGNDGQVPGSAAISYYTNVSLGQDFLQAISRHGVTSEQLEHTDQTDLIADSDELDLLREVLTTKYTCISLNEDKDFESIVEIGADNMSKFEDFQNCEMYKRHKDLPSFLRRYTVTGQYIKILKYYIDALERAKDYEKANYIIRKGLKFLTRSPRCYFCNHSTENLLRVILPRIVTDNGGFVLL